MRDTINLRVRIGAGAEVATKSFDGRVAWALGRLIDAGERGVTPIEYPAPRWSQYVMMLRREGVVIETIEERHGGPFRGWHGRYVLRSPVIVLHRREAA